MKFRSFPALLVILVITIACPVFAGESPDTSPAVTTDNMVLVPAAIVQLKKSISGVNEESEDKTQTTHTDAFYMDKYEVTQEDYIKVRGFSLSPFVDCPKCPATWVSWFEAKAYCEAVGKRLPTEAEWAYAAKGESNGKRYGKADRIAWCAVNAKSQVHPVGKKLPNRFGLYDMLGNVREWCSDWHGSVQVVNGEFKNPKGPETGTSKVNRGGSFLDKPGKIAFGTRSGDHPSDRNANLGFRCAKDAGNTLALEEQTTD